MGDTKSVKTRHLLINEYSQYLLFFYKTIKKPTLSFIKSVFNFFNDSVNVCFKSFITALNNKIFYYQSS